MKTLRLTLTPPVSGGPPATMPKKPKKACRVGRPLQWLVRRGVPTPLGVASDRACLGYVQFFPSQEFAHKYGVSTVKVLCMLPPGVRHIAWIKVVRLLEDFAGVIHGKTVEDTQSGRGVDDL